jgi:hypothetical protein
MLPVRHEAEEMESFRMLRGEIERMAVCRFGLGEAAGPLMDSSFFKPRLNRRRGAVMPHRFLTPSLSPIHDASQRVAEKRPTVKDKEAQFTVSTGHDRRMEQQ